MDKYILGEKLGEGSYSKVYKAKCQVSGHLVALKEIRKELTRKGIPVSCVREISILKELRHPNIVSLLDTVLDEDRTVLILELLESDLESYLDHLYPTEMDPALVKSYLYQILQAILFCHKRRIIHRDLKPCNLLIGPNKILKVADFGMGRTIDCSSRTYSLGVVTQWYRAPEILLGDNMYTYPIDIWSIGCIFAEMTTGKVIFPGKSELDQLKCIFKVLTTPTEETWPRITSLPGFQNTSYPVWTTLELEKRVPRLDEDGVKLLMKMFIYDPEKRISAREAIKDEFFHNVDTSKLPLTSYER